jgi:hypothetical protein
MQLLVCSEVDGQKIWMLSCHGSLEYHLVVAGLVKLLLVKALLKHSWYWHLIIFIKRFFANDTGNGKRGRGKPTLTWQESVKRDLKDWSTIKELALDRREWKLSIHVSEPWFSIPLLLPSYVSFLSFFLFALCYLFCWFKKFIPPLFLRRRLSGKVAIQGKVSHRLEIRRKATVAATRTQRERVGGGGAVGDGLRRCAWDRGGDGSE